jgi:hypothetical protein
VFGNLVSAYRFGCVCLIGAPALQAEIRNLQQKVAIYRKTAESQRRLMDSAGSADHLMALENMVNEKILQIEQLQTDNKLLRKVTKIIIFLLCQVDLVCMRACVCHFIVPHGSAMFGLCECVLFISCREPCACRDWPASSVKLLTLTMINH